ncbi:ABC transporter ATP-binding protein [Methyloferula stellata]|uniref:ABC transporter ATP-binding protein n=1 Tax=Methyloferula stellata TaxID=876270 RepID=UPI0003809140|nr:ABC transporter ATP-binding protein [Methyloferula stellata]
MSPVGALTQLDVSVLRKTYQTASGETRVVLRDLAFTLQAGEVCALIGPSGSGKTTLLRIMAGLDTDFEGTITHPPDQKLAMVFQEPRLLPWRSVLQNIRLAAPHADPADLKQITDSLGLADHLTFFPGELSLGLARRVSFARALAIKPDILMLDEPFVSLDNSLAARLRDELATLVEARHITTLLVTHDVEEAIYLADRILMLSTKPARVIVEIRIDKPRHAMTEASAARIKGEVIQLLTKSTA